ncbi:MAG: DNA mismatch repair protein MutL [Phycisphaerae bacterium]|nr:DNA mismatch repair protein MutL [Phycisphaerae bacterium]
MNSSSGTAALHRAASPKRFSRSGMVRPEPVRYTRAMSHAETHALRLGPDVDPVIADERARIRPLGALLVNQIAAGEVIERPASVVKELVENALDAGARSVVVDLDDGGMTRIAITDDGVGIPRDELALAVAPHATSKISEAEDLDRIATMGFRGEALASIASVSRLTLLSRERGAEEAWSLSVEGSNFGDPVPAAAPEGTQLVVRDLFFNTPARRKFLKTAATERGRCLDWIRDLAIARPAVGFTVRTDGREAISLPSGQSPLDRVLAVLGREVGSQLLEVSVDRFDDARGVLIWGLVGRPAIARATAAAQRVFLNGRTIRDKVTQHALREAYRGLIEPGRYPTAVLMIEMAPSAVDVNVHPAKLEVRFRDQSMVHQAVLHGVREALRAADLTRDAASASRPTFDVPRFGPGDVDRSAEAFVQRVRDLRDDAERAVRPVLDVDAIRGAVHTAVPHEVPASTTTAPSPRPERFLQVHDSYLVVEDERGVLLIDQHALHERVMFESLLERVGAGTLESQSLLAPLTFSCEPDRLDALESLAPALARIGLIVEPLGPRTAGIRSAPTLLFARNVDPAAFAADLLDRAATDGFAPDPENALREILDMMACKAAVKAGDRLADDEIRALLEQRERVERSSSCPHGRPTSVRLSLSSLEKLFERR